MTTLAGATDDSLAPSTGGNSISGSVVDLKLGLSCGAGPVTDSAHDWIRRASFGTRSEERRTFVLGR